MNLTKKQSFILFSSIILITILLTSVTVLAIVPSETLIISSGAYPGVTPAYTIWTDSSGNIYSKTAYGALAYTGTNMSDILQSCINALPEPYGTTSESGRIFIKNGHYSMDTPVTISGTAVANPIQGFIIEGESKVYTQLRPDDDHSLFVLDTISAGLTFQNLGFAVPSAVETAGYTSWLIDTTTSAQWVQFFNCYFQRGNGIRLLNAAVNDISFCSFETVRNCVYIEAGTSDAAYNTISCSYFSQINGTAISINGNEAGTKWASYNIISDNKFSGIGSSDYAVTLNYSRRSSITDNIIREIEYGIYESTSLVQDMLYNNNNFKFVDEPITLSGGLRNNVGTANVGFVTYNSGYDSIASGTTSLTLEHGLDIEPDEQDFSVIGKEDPTNSIGTIWISGLNSTHFTVNVENDPGASNWNFGWNVRVDTD